MPGYTPTFTVPYPVDTDPLADWPAISEAQALALDGVLKTRVPLPNLANLNDVQARLSKVETPYFGEYTGTQTQLPTATERGITTLTKVNQTGGWDATVAGNFLEIPAGLWVLTWDVNVVNATVSGRNFVAVGGGPGWSGSVLNRHPFATTGEDTGGTSFLLPLTAARTGLALSIYAETTGTYTARHRIRVARIGTIPGP